MESVGTGRLFRIAEKRRSQDLNPVLDRSGRCRVQSRHEVAFGLPTSGTNGLRGSWSGVPSRSEARRSTLELEEKTDDPPRGSPQDLNTRSSPAVVEPFRRIAAYVDRRSD